MEKTKRILIVTIFLGLIAFFALQGAEYSGSAVGNVRSGVYSAYSAIPLLAILFIVIYFLIKKK